MGKLWPRPSLLSRAAPFHTIIWPALLLGVGHLGDTDGGASLNLPYNIPANQFMTIDQAQFSKSRNRAIWLHDLLSRYDPDVIRYYVTSVLPESGDTDFPGQS